MTSYEWEKWVDDWETLRDDFLAQGMGWADDLVTSGFRVVDGESVDLWFNKLLALFANNFASIPKNLFNPSSVEGSVLWVGRNPLIDIVNRTKKTMDRFLSGNISAIKAKADLEGAYVDLLVLLMLQNIAAEAERDGLTSAAAVEAAARRQGKSVDVWESEQQARVMSGRVPLSGKSIVGEINKLRSFPAAAIGAPVSDVGGFDMGKISDIAQDFLGENWQKYLAAGGAGLVLFILLRR